MKILKSKEEIESLSGEYILFVHTKWSPPSVRLLESKELAEVQLPVYVLDADEFPEYAQHVRGTPTLFWMDDEITKKWQTGYLPGATLSNLFELGTPDD